MMNLRALRACALIMSLTFLAACGGGGGGGNPPAPPPQNQTIAFATPGTVNGSVGGTVTNVASGGAGTGAITYASGNTSVATVNATSGVVTLLAAGTATINATKAASSGFNSATATYTLNVAAGTQTITFAQGGPLNVLLDSITNNGASAGAGTGAITYASSNTAAVIVNPTSAAATAVGVGTATITATKAADANYNQAQATYSINVQTANTVSAWIGDAGSQVHMPASANGKQFGRARVSDCTPIDTVVTCTNALLTSVNGAPVNDTSATLTTPAYYAVVDGSTIGTPVVVNSKRFVERIGHAVAFFDGRYWLISGAQPILPGAGPPAAHVQVADVWSSLDGRSWKLETSTAAFGGRWFHHVLVYDDAMWLIGGSRSNGSGLQDVWRSTDGANWQQLTGIAPFIAGPLISPLFLTAEVFNGQMWVVHNGQSYSSTDGVQWTPRSVAGAIDGGTQREYATLTAYNGALWYMAGARNTGGMPAQRNAVSDVWRSPDGVMWTQVNASAFTARYQHAAFVLNDRLWVFGGRGVVNGTEGLVTATAHSTTDGITWTPEATTNEVDRSYLTRIVQENDRVTLVGGIQRAYSDKTWQTTNGNNWTELLAVTHSPRLLGSAVSFDGFMWSIGGGRLDGLDTNEVWRSADGLNWTQVPASGPIFSPRGSHASVVFNNRMWVIGGWDFFAADGGTPNTFNDVWSSADGASWTQHAAPAPFAARALHEVVVFNGRLWVIGGYAGTTRFNDIWSSADGTTWIQETASAAFTARYGHKVVAFNNALWLFGGSSSSNGNFAQGTDEVWKSLNGRDWVQLAPGPHFAARTEHAVAVLDTVLGDRIFLTTGFSSNDYYTGVRFKDVWSTADGLNWTQEKADAPFAGRNAAQLINHNGELYLISGFGVSRQHHIWRSADGVSWRLGFSNPIVAP